MNSKNIIQAIGNKEMDRKTFLKYGGLFLLSLVGFKTIISLLTQSDNKLVANMQNKEATRGFGGGRYGV